MITWFWLLVGLAILTAGAELLVRGAVGLAAALRVSPLVIGLTVVAFGTSAPELVVSLESTFSDRGEIALGNVIGSNVEPNASGNNEFLAIESGYSFGFNLGGDGKLSIFNNSAASAGDVVYDSDLPGTYANLRLDSSSNVEVVGALSKGSGSFRIKHPLINKKSTHHLVHSFIEGPYCDLIYRGRVNLVNGRAEIDLDSHFKMTNGTLRRLLTNRISMTSNESGFTPVKSSVAIVDLATVLTIESQDPASTDRISWMVIGERDDDHIKATNWTDENGRPILEPDQEDPNKPK